MIASSALFSVMSVLVRLSEGISPFTTALFRFAIGIALLSFLALLGKIKIDYRNIRILLVRGFAGGISVFLFYFSITRIGLAKGTVISNTYPLFATILGSLFLKEQIRPISGVFVAVCIVGLVLVNHDAAAGAFLIDEWVLLAFVGSIAAAVAVVAIRKLSTSDSPYSIYMSQCLFGFWMVLIPANAVPSEVGLTGAFLLLGVGVVATLAQLIMTWSYRHVHVSTGSLLSMLMTVFNVLIGTTLFKESRGIVSILGMGLIILSCAGIVIANRPRNETGHSAAEVKV